MTVSYHYNLGYAPCDVSGIEMEEVPQTQFIPLPDAMCLVILELNNTRVVATLDTVKEKLKKCYRHMQLPEDWLLMSTVSDLIMNRKIFYNGCGYFVVTPDTFYIPPIDPSLAWLPYHSQQQQIQGMQPMTQCNHHVQSAVQTGYFSNQQNNVQGEVSPLQANFTNNICVGHPQNGCVLPNTPKTTKSACCQTEEAMGTRHACKTATTFLRKLDPADVIEECELPADVKRGRSNSFRDKKTKNGEHKKRNMVKRSSSVRETNDKVKKREDKKENVENGSKGSKTSIFSKLFGRNRNKREKEPEKAPLPSAGGTEVEYATFSAQFPPPDMQWPHPQLNKHDRVKAWVKTQINNIDEESSVVSKTRRGERKSHHRKREFHRPSNIKAVCPHDHDFTHRTEYNKENCGPSGFGRDDCCSDATGSHVLPLHSTPIYKSNHHPPSQPCQRCQCSTDIKSNPYPHRVKHRSHHAENDFPTSVSDIEYKVIGKLPEKHSAQSESRDSGVNCLVASSTRKHGNQNRKQKTTRKPTRHNSMAERSDSVKVRGFVPTEFRSSRFFVEPVFTNAGTKEVIYENLRGLRRQKEQQTCAQERHGNQEPAPKREDEGYDAEECYMHEEPHSIPVFGEKCRNDGKLVFDHSLCDSDASRRTAIHVTLAEVHSPGDKTSLNDEELGIVDSGLGNSEDANCMENMGGERVNAFDNKYCDGVYFSKPCNSLKDVNNSHEVKDVNNSHEVKDVNISAEGSPVREFEKLTDGPILIQKSHSVNFLNNHKPKCNQKTNNLAIGNGENNDDKLANKLDVKADIEELKQSIQKLNFPRDFEVVGIL